MRPYQRERAPGGGHPPPNYPNANAVGYSTGPNMPAPLPRNMQGGGPGTVRPQNQGIPRPSMGSHPNHTPQQQHLQQQQQMQPPQSAHNNSMAHPIGPSGPPLNSRAQPGPPGSRPKPLPGISGSKIAAGRVVQARNAGIPAFQGQLPGTALSGSETDVSTSTENLTQVITKCFPIHYTYTLR